MSLERGSGVGKTTLTFHMATQYALTHPRENVLVIDLCPQANVSSALLQGRKKVARLTSERKTVSFYLHQVSSSNNLSTVNLPALLTQVSGFNNQIPPNVYVSLWRHSSRNSLVHWNKRGMRTLQMTVLGSSLPPLSAIS